MKVRLCKRNFMLTISSLITHAGGGDAILNFLLVRMSSEEESAGSL